MKPSKEELTEILRMHSLWLAGNAEGKRAILRGADLRSANLQSAILRCANLQSAILRGADLRSANLQSATLHGADLQSAYLQGANLQSAILRGADLRCADLRCADLQGADLPTFQICPQEGSFIAFKKLHGAVAKLRIPEEAKRTSSLVGRKCRAEFVEVLEIWAEGGCPAATANSRHDVNFAYEVGTTVCPDKYDDDPRVECTNGIHFFMTRKEAEDY